ncbi:hypothetical protein E5D57_004495 [Metarhizium anisopliae]|nr:hypothetical protein E5D57_004495 [Metarhizium anisopliae]
MHMKRAKYDEYTRGGQPSNWNGLLLHGQAQAYVVDEDGDPRDQDAGGCQVDQPPEDGDGVARQAHEAEEAKGHEEKDAGVGHTPGRGPQENPGRLLLDGQAVQHTGAGQETLVGGRPGRGDDDGVDDGGDGGNAGGRGGNDKGALGRVAALAVQAAVLAGHEHADNENGQHVEQHDADKDVLAGGGDGLARVPGLGAGHGDGLDAGKGEDGARHDAPVAEEPAPVADGGDFRGDGQDVAVDEVPADGEAPGRVDEELGVPHKGAGDGEQRRDLAQGELDGADDEADGGIAEQRAERTAALHGAAQAQEQAGADGARNAEHGQMPLGEPALEMAALAGRDEVAGVVVVAVIVGIVAVVVSERRPRRSILPLNVGRETRVVGRARKRSRRRRPVALGAVAVHDGCVAAPGAFDAGKEALEGHGKVRLATGNQAPSFQPRVETAETAFPTTCPARRDEEWIGSRGTQGPRMGVAQASKQRTLSTLRRFSRALFF